MTLFERIAESENRGKCVMHRLESRRRKPVFSSEARAAAPHPGRGVRSLIHRRKRDSIALAALALILWAPDGAVERLVALLEATRAA